MARLGLVLAFGAILLAAASAATGLADQAPPAPSCRFTLESAAGTLGPDGRKVTNWVLTCHRISRVAGAEGDAPALQVTRPGAAPPPPAG